MFGCGVFFIFWVCLLVFLTELCNFRAVLLHICQRRCEADGSKGCCMSTNRPSQHEHICTSGSAGNTLSLPAAPHCSCPSYLGPCQVCHVTRWPDVACCVTCPIHPPPLRAAPHIAPSALGYGAKLRSVKMSQAAPGPVTPLLPSLCPGLL